MSASATAQINARIDPDLKTRGDAGLAAAGITPTQAIRALWELAAGRIDDPAAIEDALYPDRATARRALDADQRTEKVAVAQRGPSVVEEAMAQLGIDVVAVDAPELSYDELKELAARERFAADDGGRR